MNHPFHSIVTPAHIDSVQISTVGVNLKTMKLVMDMIDEIQPVQLLILIVIDIILLIVMEIDASVHHPLFLIVIMITKIRYGDFSTKTTNISI